MGLKLSLLACILYLGPLNAVSADRGQSHNGGSCHLTIAWGQSNVSTVNTNNLREAIYQSPQEDLYMWDDTRGGHRGVGGFAPIDISKYHSVSLEAGILSYILKSKSDRSLNRNCPDMKEFMFKEGKGGRKIEYFKPGGKGWETDTPKFRKAIESMQNDFGCEEVYVDLLYWQGDSDRVGKLNENFEADFEVLTTALISLIPNVNIYTIEIWNGNAPAQFINQAFENHVGRNNHKYHLPVFNYTEYEGYTAHADAQSMVAIGEHFMRLSRDTLGYCGGLYQSNTRKITGRITTNTDKPIPDLEILLSGSQETSIRTDANGFYEYYTDAAGVIEIKPVLETSLSEGVSPRDVVLLRRHILGLVLLDNPYALLAGDLDGNNRITAADMVLLRKLLRLRRKNNQNTSWIFVPDTFGFDQPQNPFLDNLDNRILIERSVKEQEINFIGFKIGDLDGSSRF